MSLGGKAEDIQLQKLVLRIQKEVEALKGKVFKLEKEIKVLKES